MVEIAREMHMFAQKNNLYSCINIMCGNAVFLRNSYHENKGAYSLARRPLKTYDWNSTIIYHVQAGVVPIFVRSITALL